MILVLWGFFLSVVAYLVPTSINMLLFLLINILLTTLLLYLTIKKSYNVLFNFKQFYVKKTFFLVLKAKFDSGLSLLKSIKTVTIEGKLIHLSILERVVVCFILFYKKLLLSYSNYFERLDKVLYLFLYNVVYSLIFIRLFQSDIEGFLFFNIIFYIYMAVFVLLNWLENIIMKDLEKEAININRVFYLCFYMFLISEIMIFSPLIASSLYINLDPVIGSGGKSYVNYSIYINSSDSLYNSLLLWISGVLIVKSYVALVNKNKTTSLLLLAATIMLALVFLFMQYNEYKNSLIAINSASNHSLFYILTGLHGFHVFVGIILLSNLFLQFCNKYISSKKVEFNNSVVKDSSLYNLNNNLTFDVGDILIALQSIIIYWHFVDIVWQWYVALLINLLLWIFL